MAELDFGAPSNVASYTDHNVYSPVSLPSGRAAADGHLWAYVTALRAYASGRGASRTIDLSLDSHGGTAGFTRPSAGSAGDTGWVGCGFYCEGGSDDFRITSSGSFYYGWGGSGDAYDNNGLHRAGSLFGGFLFIQSPSAPGTPTASSPVPGELDLTWTAPASNGDSGITGYRVQIADDVGFTVNVTNFDVGNVLTLAITGLTPGKTYFARVFAKNAVTDGKSTTSVPSGYTSLAVKAGAHRWDGSSELTGVLMRWDGTKEVPVSTAVRWNGTAEVPLS